MGTGMQQRHGTTAEWAAANRILLLGEIGWDRLTQILKIGDGVTNWVNLKSAYVRTNGGDEIVPSDVNTKGLSIKGMVGQVADLLSAKTNGGAGFRVDKDGIPYFSLDRLVYTSELTAATAARIADVDAEEAARIAADNAESVLRVAGDGLAIQKAVITTLGDILVGTGPSAVARLAKGADGMLLTMVGGNVVWANAPAAIDNSKVLKAGDTMTGLLDLTIAVAGNNGVLRIRGINTGKAISVRPGGVDGIDFVNNAFSATIASLTDAGVFNALQVKDNGNRVYSASNPPPVSGMTILLANFITIPAPPSVSLGTFVAPSTGRVVVHTVYTPSNTNVNETINISLDNSTFQVTGATQNVTAGSVNAQKLGTVVGFAAFTGLTPGATYTVYGKTASVGVAASIRVEG